MGIRPYLTPSELDGITGRVARELSRAFEDKNPVLVGVLKGSYVFLADLSRKLGIDHEIDFIQTACYGMRDEPAAEVLILRDITAEIKGRHVVLVEDIIDRGHTARVLLAHFANRGAASVALCAMLRRTGRAHGLRVDFVGQDMGEGFVVGYGMDHKERYRNLPGLYLLEE